MLNFGGKPAQILQRFITGEIEVYISPFILNELERILREKFEWEENRIADVIGRIREKAVEVHPKRRVSVIEGKRDDNRILECALEGKAEYIISGDKRHLLPLKEYRGIKILSPAEFLMMIGAFTPSDAEKFSP
ncbi:MAG: putative toxin-antitoxin system toxin component, PIN family [Thermoplasmata archaeon]|nr:MAG: putative toxin-antitoxin system toxin component, PIN family [Thermoplasmata archaeon]